jgi:hypothetical protein
MDGVPPNVRADVHERSAARNEREHHREVFSLVPSKVEGHDGGEPTIDRVAWKPCAPETADERDSVARQLECGKIRISEQLTVVMQQPVVLADAECVVVLSQLAPTKLIAQLDRSIGHR